MWSARIVRGAGLDEVMHPHHGDGNLRQVMCRSREEAHEQAKSLPNGVTIRRSNLEDVFIKLTGEKIE